MEYSKYSDYSLEQIRTEKYEELCQILLSMAKDEKVKQKMKAILYEGGYEDFSVNTGLTKNNPYIESKKRIEFAYILATNPETLDVLIENNINLFHGTTVTALPNILKYGMQSVDKQANKGIPTLTGEEWSRIQGKRAFISFAEDIGIASDYAAFDTEAFGVVIGMSSSSLNQLKKCHVHSDLPEVGIMDNVPLEHIKSIAVPEDKVEFVQKLVGNNEIMVIPMTIGEKFYYIDPEMGEIIFDIDKAKQLAEKEQSTRNQFDSQEMSQMTRTRKSSGIQSIFEKIKEIINNRGKVNGKDSRDK